jgi:hypothetical protein
MVIFPIALIMALMRLGEPHPEPRMPATFAVPAAVLLLLVLWVSSALGSTGMGADAPSRPVPEPVSIPAPHGSGQALPPTAGWQVRVGEPQAAWDARLLKLVNRLDMERDIGGSYGGVPDSGAERVRLAVYVLADGTVDPARVRTEEATDPWLADAAVLEGREMRFVFLDADGDPAEGWVWMDVTYGP